MGGSVEWVILGLTFLVGGLTGAVLYYVMSGGGRDMERLREELREAKEEAEKYRIQVTEHFEKTSELFEDVTARYRNLYDHLSHGAASFCDDIQHNPRLKFSAAELLPGAAEAAAAAEQSSATESEPAEADPDAPLEGEKVVETASVAEAEASEQDVSEVEPAAEQAEAETPIPAAEATETTEAAEPVAEAEVEAKSELEKPAEKKVDA